MLDATSALRHLLERGVLDTRIALEQEVVCRDASRRNGIFLVSVDGDPCYVLKCGPDAEQLHHEASTYAFLDSGPLSETVPKLLDFDETSSSLVFAYVPGGIGLSEFSERSGGRYSTLHARALGRFLARLHRLEGDRQYTARLAERARLPFVLHFDRPPFELIEAATTTPANLALLQAVQRSNALAAAFDEIRDAWRWDSIVHGDMRLENVLACKGPAGKRRTRIAVLDWEFASLGDRRWDLANVIAHFLARWILSMPMSRDLALQESLRLARVPIEQIRRAFGAFWAAYWRETGDAEKPTGAELRVQTLMIGISLVQIAYEQLQHSIELTASAVRLLQLSENFTTRTEEATSDFLELGCG
jgi:aminoglycoside phosphotransferase (APT) family kinase protein